MTTDTDDALLIDSLAWYQTVAAHDLLTADEERALGALARAGDLEARNTLIEHNLRLVWSVAKRYSAPRSRHRPLSIADLIGHGNLGLMRAAEKFDPTKGFRFSTYATYWIAQAIQRAIIDEGTTVRLPVHMAEQLTRLARVEWDLAAQSDSHPTDSELAAALGWPLARVARVRAARRMAVCASLDVEIREAEGLHDVGLTLGDMIAADSDTLDEVEANDETLRARALLAELLAELEPKQRQVLGLRHGLDGGGQRTLEQVGAVLGVTRERARQIEANALRKLRAHAAVAKQITSRRAAA